MARQDGEGERGEGDFGQPALLETLAETRALRRELQELARGGGNVNRGGDPVSTGRDDRPESTGEFVDDLGSTRDFDRSADNISADVLSLFRELRARGVPVRDIDELRRLAAEFRASEFSGNPALLEEEARKALAIAEQLEMALNRSANAGEGRVRTNTAEDIPEAHREIVADYYRRLGEAGDDEQ
jgi:hypothetical protein